MLTPWSVKFIKELFKDPTVPGSWGIKEISLKTDCIDLIVYGFNIRGQIKITYNGITYNVLKVYKNYTTVLLQNISQTEIIKSLDSLIEKCDNYSEKVLMENK